MHYRRARTLLIIIGLFWFWLGMGGGGTVIETLHSPVTAAVVLYGLAVSIPVTIAAAVLAVVRMILTHPRRSAVVVRLPAAPELPPSYRSSRSGEHWRSYGEKAS